MTGETHVREEMERLLRDRSVQAGALGAAAFLLIAPLDWVSAPDHFLRFLGYRCFAAAVLLVLAAGARATRSPRLLRLLIFLAVLLASAALEAMILDFGGHRSPYFAGMILLAVIALGLLPAGTAMQLLLAATIQAVYLVPLLLRDTIADPRYFLTENYLLALILGATLLVRHYHHASLVRELKNARVLAEKELELSQAVDVRTEQLRHASQEWRATVDSTGDRIMLLDGEDRIVRANLATAQLAGRPFPALLGTPVHDIVREEDLPRELHPLTVMRQSGARARAEFQVPALGRWFLMTAEPTREGSGSEGGAVVTIRDITGVKLMQQEIRAAAERIQGILARAPFGVFIVNDEFRVEFANPAILVISGYRREEFVGACIGDFPGCIELGMRDRILAAFRGVPFRFGPSSFHCRQEGRVIQGQFTGIPIQEGGVGKVLVFVEDVTDLKEAEEERHRLAALLLQAQKMESIGTLASGIAHDFNNILLAVIGLTDATAERLPADHEARADLDAVVAAAERGSELVKQMLAFSRQQELKTRPVDVRLIVEEVRRMLAHLMPRSVRIEVRGEGDLPAVVADPVQIEQVVMNLVVNARDAMPDGGAIAVETAAVSVLGEDPGHPGVPPGRWVTLRVSDTGTGIAPEVRERIFDPFFTTKEPGEGTGLGLATVFGIVTQHGGTVRVESEPGRGSTFTVYLPAAAESAGGGTQDEPPRGTETVLLVEDDDRARRVIGRRLEDLGYRTLAAADGEEALRLAAGAGTVDLLLCDVVLPGLSARDIADALLRVSPRTRVVFMSGHPEELLQQRGLIGNGDRLIAKALGPDGMAWHVRQALDRV